MKERDGDGIHNTRFGMKINEAKCLKEHFKKLIPSRINIFF